MTEAEKEDADAHDDLYYYTNAGGDAAYAAAARQTSNKVDVRGEGSGPLSRPPRSHKGGGAPASQVFTTIKIKPHERH